ncbi:hypothetical protein ACFLWJ_01305 [Chloroflexota bacterium]
MKKKLLIIVVVLALAVGVTLGLAGTVFAQDAELIGDLADGAKPYRGYAGKVVSLEEGVVTLERGGGWMVQITLAEETTYSIIRQEATAEEFETYVADALATDETVRVVARAERQEDGTIIADAIKIIPKLVAGEVTSVSDTELILETADGQMAIALTEETRYGIPGQGQVTAAEFAAYFNGATANGNVIKVAVRANDEDGTVTALGVKVMRANGAQKRMMRVMQRLRNGRLNGIMNRMGQAE